MTSTYFMFGSYSPDSIKKISPHRTDDVVGIVERFNGQILAMYALIGAYDVVIVMNLPGNQEAMEVSVALHRATGISFTTAPALSIGRYDELINKDVNLPQDEDFA